MGLLVGLNWLHSEMKNVFLLLFCLCFLFSCRAQESLLIGTKPITDLSNTPIYKRLIDTKEGVTQWKTEYEYIDDIEINGIKYLSDGLGVTGFMVKPKAPGNYPCIIYNRGGNRDFGQLLIAHAVMWLGELASQGYVVIASNYRGNGGGEGQEEFGGKDVNDVLNLIDVLEEIEGADTEKIGMYGWSRGGMMTFLALTRTDKIKAACVGGANSDLTNIDRPNMETGVYAELIPDYATNKEAALKKRSAVYWADQFPKDVPILMLHGNSDWRVKSTNSLKLALEFEKHRIPYRLKIFEGGDHGIREHRAEVNREVYAWFERFLKNGEALPDMEFHGR